MKVALILVFLALACCPPVYSDDIIFNSQNGHYYQLVIPDNPMSFKDADEFASGRAHNSKQGYLVTVSSASEEAFLHDLLYTALPSTSGIPTIWAGAARKSASWVWVALGRQSLPFYDVNKKNCSDYCNWNSTASFPTNALCMQIFTSSETGPTPGKWRPAPCTSLSEAIIVEYDASKTCSSGYVYRSASGWCVDVDECSTTANLCGAGYSCSNTVGSYECIDVDECAANATICGNPGLRCVNRNGTYSCLDINECLITPSVCPGGYECHNTVGSYTCDDVNECVVNSTLCSKGYTCTNTPGSYACVDINECTELSQSCPFGTKCVNTIGSYTCDSKFYFIKSEYNNLVIDQRDDDGVIHLITAVQKTTNVSSQLWRFTPDGFVVNALNSLVVDADQGRLESEVRLLLWPMKRVEEAYNQLWSYDAQSRLWLSQSVNVAFDILFGNRNPGANIILFPPKTTNEDQNANQRWQLIEYNGSTL